jgi:hypothetical protein
VKLHSGSLRRVCAGRDEAFGERSSTQANISNIFPYFRARHSSDIEREAPHNPTSNESEFGQGGPQSSLNPERSYLHAPPRPPHQVLRRLLRPPGEPSHLERYRRLPFAPAPSSRDPNALGRLPRRVVHMLERDDDLRRRALPGGRGQLLCDLADPLMEERIVVFICRRPADRSPDRRQALCAPCLPLLASTKHVYSADCRQAPEICFRLRPPPLPVPSPLRVRRDYAGGVWGGRGNRWRRRTARLVS